jgi:glutamate/aspartate transport system substrate-binding protein
MKSAALLVLGAMALSTAASANTMSKVTETRKITLGVRESSPPLSFSLGPGKYTGYHVELCEKIVTSLRRRLQLAELTVQYQLVTSQNRIPLLLNGTVDIECGSTTNNATRQKEVAFALTTYVTEIRMATRVDSGIRSVAQLGGKTVSSTTGSTAVQAIRKHKRGTGLEFKELYGKDHSDAFLLLESGRSDVMVIDDNVLTGLIALSKDPKAYHLVGETLAVEPIAIMMRKDDPALKKFIDDHIAEMMKSGELASHYQKWFMQPIAPRNTVVNLPMGETLKQLIAKPNDLPAESYQDSQR